jgi:ribosomal protein S18 acetylase RimI-like enzyme
VINAAPLPLVRRLTPVDLPAALELQEAASAGLPAGFVRSRSDDDLRAYLDRTLGVAYGILEGTALTAMALLRIPSEEHPNSDAGPPFPRVPAREWPRHAGFLEHAMVLPAARGRGHQRTLLDARLRHAALTGMNWICAGVHLDNAVSLANLLARGLAIVGIRFDTGYPLLGLLGSLDPLRFTTDPYDRMGVLAGDHAGHRDALWDGYVGVRLAAGGVVIYERVLGESNAMPSRGLGHPAITAARDARDADNIAPIESV